MGECMRSYFYYLLLSVFIFSCSSKTIHNRQPNSSIDPYAHLFTDYNSRYKGRFLILESALSSNDVLNKCNRYGKNDLPFGRISKTYLSEAKHVGLCVFYSPHRKNILKKPIFVNSDLSARDMAIKDLSQQCSLQKPPENIPGIKGRLALVSSYKGPYYVACEQTEGF